VTKKSFYLIFTFLVLFDALATYYHLAIWQMIIRPSITVLLFFYYCRERDFPLENRDYFLIGYFIFAIIDDLLYIHIQASNLSSFIITLVIKFGLLIYVLLVEATFYIKNQRTFILTSILWVFIGFLISYKFVLFAPNSFLDEIVGAELGFLSAIVLFRKTNKKSYEQLVLGIMFSILAVILSGGNSSLAYEGVEIFGRTAFSIGNLFITFGILQGMVYEKH
jgi:hypothetical protein